MVDGRNSGGSEKGRNPASWGCPPLTSTVINLITAETTAKSAIFTEMAASTAVDGHFCGQKASAALIFVQPKKRNHRETR